MNAVIYDLEIKNAIAGRGEAKKPGVEYCDGWGDHAGMGISVLCAYDMEEDRCRVFCDDNRDDFAQLVANRKVCVGFNSVNFDDKVLKACWDITVPQPSVYDLMREARVAAGLKAEGFGGGLSLDGLAEATCEQGKVGDGAMAPVHWQRGEIGTVIDYCMRDVHLTWLLFDLVCKGRPLTHPKTSRPLHLRKPA